MASEFDNQSFFSDNVESDDNDSLFGDGDDTDLSSLLIEAAASESDPDTEPVVPDEPSSLSSSSTRPLVCGLTLPTLPKPVVQLTLPVVPDPLAASLSHQDGHTSGGLVVNDAHPLSLEISNDAQHGVLPDPSRVSLAQIRGLRYAKSRPKVSYPRRIDLDDTGCKDRLWRDLTLSRTIKFEDLWSRLELTVGEGKDLNKALSTYFEGEWFVKPAATIRARMTHPDHTKVFLVKLAFHMLSTDKWGITWFGPNCSSAATRTLFWPDESTLLLFYFTMLLYRIFENVKQRIRLNEKVKKQQQQQVVGYLSNSTRATSPALSDMTQPSVSSRMESSGPATDTTPAQSRPSTPSTSMPTEAHKMWVDATHQVAEKLASRPPLPLSPRKRPRETSESDSPNDGESFFSSLVNDVAMCKRRKIANSFLPNQQPEVYGLEIPPDAKLTYYVYVKDKSDGSDLSSGPVEYKHTDTVISKGAFSQLVSSFKAAEYEPIVEIQTFWGRKAVTTADEWDSAVFSIYNVRRSGGVVEVDIFV
ncbi:hypothetical protein QBC35DRAFT_521725 [Podospora australis]|uniref:Uncharacterized protein n=1 Tax=Podospora australis TaxID=1536484 RepID=A0AAN6X229_9PEZI|nr:hypothetical protein QBC35DRAFT_521725 [Podospora australis]